MKFILYVLLNLSFCLVALITAAPVDTNITLIKIDDFASSDENYRIEENENNDFNEAVDNFERNNGFKTAEKRDLTTTDSKSLARCRIFKQVVATNRKKRYVLDGKPFWNKKISYAITKYSLKLSRSTVDEEIQKAFDKWSKYTDLIFTPRQRGRVDIELRFEEGIHDNFFWLTRLENSFDGTNGTLAHSYLDSSGTKQIHFDDEENWTINSRKGFNLRQVAIHEIGHALGLDHSDVRGSVMNEFYYKTKLELDLHPDDIKGIQVLYGKKTSSISEEEATNKYNSSSNQIDVSSKQFDEDQENLNGYESTESRRNNNPDSLEDQLRYWLGIEGDFEYRGSFDNIRKNSNNNHATDDIIGNKHNNDEGNLENDEFADLLNKLNKIIESIENSEDQATSSERTNNPGSVEEQYLSWIEAKYSSGSKRHFDNSREDGNNNNPVTVIFRKKQDNNEENGESNELVDLSKQLEKMLESEGNFEGQGEDGVMKVTIHFGDAWDRNESEEKASNNFRKWFDDESDEDINFIAANDDLIISF